MQPESPPVPAPNRRLSLTKTQRETAMGAELLSLCSTATADGSLSGPEVAELRAWLTLNNQADLPAVQFLSPIVERIVSDGHVSQDERRELFLAIEKILPTDIREMSRTARQEAERSKGAETRSLALAAKEQERSSRERVKKPHYFDFMVAGTKYEGRQAVIERSIGEDDTVYLERDRTNPHSPNAIQVLTGRRQQIGFVPEEEAQALAPLLDSGLSYSANVKKVLEGATHRIPVIVARVVRSDGKVESAVREVYRPPSERPRSLLSAFLTGFLAGLFRRKRR